MAELWWRGRLAGLPAAIAFTLTLNLFLIARYLYPQWIAGGLVSIGFWIGLAIWVFYVARSIRELPELISPRSVSETPDRFSDAQHAYLRGQWQEAEGLLTDVLSIEPRDPPALLLLTAVYRLTNRLEAANLLLQEIRRLEVADHWWLEVESERQKLGRASKRATSEKHPKQADHSEGGRNAADMTANHESIA